MARHLSPFETAFLSFFHFSAKFEGFYQKIIIIIVFQLKPVLLEPGIVCLSMCIAYFTQTA
jgi:hypothetical protein